jgi:hypothetical protein
MTAQTVPVAWQEQNKRRTTAYRSNSLGRTTWTTLRFAKVSGSGHVSSSSRLLLLYANVGVNYKNMKQTLLILSILDAILTCCEKDIDGFKKSSFLIVGDSINCDYKNSNPDLVFSFS